jgi:hypothetical protein
MTAVPPRRAAETSTVTAEITFPDLNNGQVASLIIAVGDVPVASAACTATRTQEAWVGVNINSTSWGAVHQSATSPLRCGKKLSQTRTESCRMRAFYAVNSGLRLPFQVMVACQLIPRVAE